MTSHFVRYRDKTIFRDLYCALEQFDARNRYPFVHSYSTNSDYYSVPLCFNISDLLIGKRHPRRNPHSKDQESHLAIKEAKPLHLQKVKSTKGSLLSSNEVRLRPVER